LKKIVTIVAVSALAVSMVLPVVRSVNVSAGKPATIDRTLTADGWPLPPGPPRIDATLVADGWPLPPGPPRTDATLVADGWPLPPGPPRTDATLVADGWPLPQDRMRLTSKLSYENSLIVRVG
jgi:hypothetical protein